MKKVSILVMAAFLVISLTSFASAVTVQPTTFTQTLEQAQFNVVNLDTNTSVTLYNTGYTEGYALQYNVGSADWITAGNIITITEVNGKKTVQFRLLDTSSSSQSFIAGAIMTFITPSLSPNGLQLYRSVRMEFMNNVDGYLFAHETLGNKTSVIDRVSPVPIPAAAWLLGTGLIGLVGIRRRFTK